MFLISVFHDTNIFGFINWASVFNLCYQIFCRNFSSCLWHQEHLQRRKSGHQMYYSITDTSWWRRKASSKSISHSWKITKIFSSWLGKDPISNLFLHTIPMPQHDLRFVLRLVVCVNSISVVSFLRRLENT